MLIFAVDKTLTPSDAVNMLEELLPVQNQSGVLGLKLRLPPHIVDAIHCTKQDLKECLLKVIMEFLQQAEPRPTWRIIIDALRTRSPIVRMSALAKKLEAAHISYTTSKCEVASAATGIFTEFYILL